MVTGSVSFKLRADFASTRKSTDRNSPVIDRVLSVNLLTTVSKSAGIIHRQDQVVTTGVELLAHDSNQGRSQTTQ